MLYLLIQFMHICVYKPKMELPTGLPLFWAAPSKVIKRNRNVQHYKKGGGGQVKFYPYENGGGQESFSHTGGGDAKRFHPLKGRGEGSARNVLPCLEGGGGGGGGG